jgi:NAD(P)-dependent dehydrogenase (short-subunit alcohol dehydrogenase family)
MSEETATLIVTGASRGIGAAVALLGAKRGYRVAVNYSADSGGANDVVERIRADGGTAIAIKADVAVENDVVRLFQEADAALGPVTALVNNAGITGKRTRVDAMEAADIARVLAVNVTGTILCAREAVRRMSTAHGGKGGAIVNISSRASAIGGAGDWVHYAASKGAIDTFTLGLAREVAGEGIRVNAVSPGLIETSIHAAAGAGDRLARLAPTVPMKRIGAPEEVAEAVIWLLSRHSSYIAGAIVPVCGGR